MVTGVEFLGDDYFRVHSGGVGFPPDHLVREDPFTPEQRAERAKREANAAAELARRDAEREAGLIKRREAEAERHAEAVRKYNEATANFPAGSHVGMKDGGDRGKVLEIWGSGKVHVAWQDGSRRLVEPDLLVRTDA
jgi:hypothetical protein